MSVVTNRDFVGAAGRAKSLLIGSGRVAAVDHAGGLKLNDVAVRVHVFDSDAITTGHAADGNRYEAGFLETIVVGQPTGQTQRAAVVWSIRNTGNHRRAETHAIRGRDQRLTIAAQHVEG